MGVPLSGTFELTPCCNMSCKMCYVRMTKAQQEAQAPLRTAEEWVALGRAAKEKGMLYLLLT
ncbi:MAG: radical SAM protein, partial [Oscillospiraceae bacterium]|nr:radical SAM protein [Oscillospiraceae bacterium]